MVEEMQKEKSESLGGNFEKPIYPLKFKAAILENTCEPLKIDEVCFKGPLDFGQVLVRIHYSGICGKQVEEVQGMSNFHGKPDPFLPHMLGHEGGGVVMDVGPGVTKVKIGDSVVLHWLKGSGINAPTPIYERDGKRINAGWITTFNEYGVISENRLTPIPRKSNLKIACLLGCCVTTGVGVILNEAKPLPGDSVSIFGCGGVGLNAIQGAKLLNAYPIIAIDKNQESLELAKKFGATHTINSGVNNVLNEIKEITEDKGTKFVIIALSKLEVIETAIEAGSIPGEVYLAGVPPLDSQITINPFAVHSARKLQGSAGVGCFPDRDIPKYLQLYENNVLNLDEIISSSISLDEINQGIDIMKSGKTGRCVVNMSENENEME